MAANSEVIVYGGAFNPPTIAHEAILRACIDYARISGGEVWVMPSGERRDKAITVPRARRLAYVEAMIASVNDGGVSVRIDTSELDRSTPTETYETVQLLNQYYPGCRFRFVFGADSTETMASWRGGEELLASLPMLVVARPGYVINPRAKQAIELPLPPMRVSSTGVRRRQAKGQSLAGLVSPSVAALLPSASPEQPDVVAGATSSAAV